MLAFAAAVFFLIITPGPGVLSTAGVGSGYGVKAGTRCAGARIAFIERSRAPGIVGGLMLQVINPKCYAVNTAFFTGFAFLPQDAVTEIIIKFAIMNAIWIPIHFLWMAAGVTLRRLDLPRRVQFAINVLMALSMLIVVALAAFTSH